MKKRFNVMFATVAPIAASILCIFVNPVLALVHFGIGGIALMFPYVRNKITGNNWYLKISIMSIPYLVLAFVEPVWLLALMVNLHSEYTMLCVSNNEFKQKTNILAESVSLVRS